MEDLIQAIHAHENFDFLVEDFPRRNKITSAGLSATVDKKMAMADEGEKRAVSKNSMQNFFLPRQAGQKHTRSQLEEDGVVLTWSNNIEEEANIADEDGGSDEVDEKANR